MPSILNNLDTRFPTFTGIESTERKVNTIQDYLYQLTEELRYALHNIDTTNMNEQELNGFVQTITKPVYARIEDDEENISEIAITAQGLSTRVTSAEGSITSLNQRADSISATVAGKIDGTQAQTLINQGIGSITLSASAGNNQSTVSIYANGIFVDSEVVYFDNIVADSIVANASIVAPTIYATGQQRYLEVTTNGITYNRKVGSSFQPSWSIGNSTSANNTLAINSYTDQGSIMIGCAGRLYLQSNGGLVLNGAMYGTLAQRPSAGTAGRIFFVRS